MSASAEPAGEQIRSAMARTNDLFNAEVFGKRNFEALDDIYTENARILPPGAEMISGPMQKGNSQSRVHVKYVVYWREGGGRWKWHVDIWNADS
jgi:hypothetical protein